MKNCRKVLVVEAVQMVGIPRKVTKRTPGITDHPIDDNLSKKIKVFEMRKRIKLMLKK